jgi:hypothetical protein
VEEDCDRLNHAFAEDKDCQVECRSGSNYLNISSRRIMASRRLEVRLDTTNLFARIETKRASKKSESEFTGSGKKITFDLADDDEVFLTYEGTTSVAEISERLLRWVLNDAA